MRHRIVCATALVLATASVAWAAESRPEVPNARRARIQVPQPPAADMVKVTASRAKFAVAPIAALKASLGSQQPTHVMSTRAAEGPNVPVTASPAGLAALVGNPYAKGSGVVLDACHMEEAATGSRLVVYHVIWRAATQKQIVAGDPQTTLSVVTPNSGASSFVEAYFMKLDPAMHTYMLTLGTTAKAENLRMQIAGMNFSGNQLIVNPTTNEIRVLFTYDSSKSEYGSYLSAILWFSWPTPLGYTGFEHFHHVQLVQVD